MDTLAIDPGKSGGAVLFQGKTPIDGYLFEKSETNNGICTESFYEWVDNFVLDQVVIEQINPVPRQAVNSTATQFFVMGQISTIVEYACSSVTIVHPASWAAFYKRMYGPRPAKELAVMHSLRIAPKLCKRFERPKKKVVHDAISDAIAIGYYFLNT